MQQRIRRISLSIAVLAFGSLALGGCAANRATLADLELENEELRGRNSLIEQALNEAEARNAQLEGENLDLRAQLGTQPVTGFEGTGATLSTRDRDIVVTVAGDVLFASGSADLRTQAKSTLDDIASVLKSRYSSNRIEIAGYTDTDPIRKTKAKWGDNENLSAQRALAVERYLATRGVNAELMHVAGFGPAVPKSSKKDSRRVEIVVLAEAY